MNCNRYDIFGDIHGHATELEKLLTKLGYEFIDGHYQHPTPSRKAIFVGDLIDRGLEIRRTLEIVKGMVDAGSALAVMGNHEFNAIAYNTQTPSGDGFLRSHNKNHDEQYENTLKELGEGPKIKPWIDWFRTLPFFLDLGELRIVHACWDEWAINFMSEARRRHGGVTTEFMVEALDKSHPGEKNLNLAHEWVLKGKELKISNNGYFKDIKEHKRHNVRACWFENPEGETYRDYIFPPASDFSFLDDVVPEDYLEAAEMNRKTGKFYSGQSCPVFFGHYWLKLKGTPEIQAPNVICVDYSIAKEGHLCAYQWQQGQPLERKNFAWVK